MLNDYHSRPMFRRQYLSETPFKVPGSADSSGGIEICVLHLIYNGLDIVAVPSRFNDPCPLAVAEALSYGLPVVATRRGGMPEMLGPELQTWLMPADDPAALAAAFGRLASSGALRRQVGILTRGRAEQALSFDRVVHDVAALYRRLAACAAA